MVMVNALYFKGIWKSPFREIYNQQGVFKVTDTKRKEVTFMTRTTRFGYAENDDLQFLKMDYKDGFYTLVILPKEVDGFRELEDVLMNLNWKEIEDAIKHLKEFSVVVQFPKFTMKSTFELIRPLRKMGLTSLFEEEEANLGGITDDNLYVSDVVQKTFINFTEMGTEAAAASVVQPEAGSAPRAEFIADHAFIFVLRHQRSGANLFIGRVLEP